MARNFNGTTQYLERTAVAVSAFPMSFACHMYVSSATGRVIGPFMYTYGGSVDIVGIEYIGSGIASGYGWRAIAIQQGMSAASERKSGSDSTTGWHMVAASWSAYTAAPTLYVDGSAISGSSTAGSGGSLNLFYTGIGSYIYAGSRGYGAGRVAEAALWNVELTAAELVALTKGYSPLCVRRQSLAGYWPLGGHYGQNDNDRWKNGYDMTATNSPTWADHGRVIYPRRRVWNVAWAAPAAYTLTCTTATCSGTRRSAGLLCGKKIAATTGTGTGSRKTLTLLAGRKIVATVGSCAGARKSLVLTAQRLLSAVVAAGSGSRKTCVLLVARSLAATQGACSGARRDARMLVGRLATCGARSGSGTPQTTGLRCSRYLAVVARLGTGTANAASLEYSGAAAELDYSVTAATEAVARRLVTESRSRSVRIEAVARRAATESLCRAVKTEALARRLVTEAR